MIKVISERTGGNVRGWQFTAPHHDLDLVELPDPAPSHGEVLIDVRASGLCHSDVGVMEGITDSALGMRPIILGHEIAGVVVSVGPGVDRIHVGDRVAVRAGADSPGVVSNGGYANLVTAPVTMVAVIPPNVPFADAAVATDAGMTSYHALIQAGALKEGESVVIIGLGGLGLFAVQIAHALGATVYGVDVREEARNLAAGLGICRRIVSEIEDLANEQVDLCCDFAGMNTLGKAIKIASPGGRIVQVGLGQAQAEIDIFTFTVKELMMVGSIGGTRGDLEAVLTLLSEGKIKTYIEQIGFDQIPDGLARLAHGGVVGRLVADLADTTA